MIVWNLLHPSMTAEHLGLLVYMLNEHDSRSAREQLDTGYRHGGGWQPFEGFKMNAKKGLSYPGDPIFYPIAMAKLRDEMIYLYPHDWVAIVQPNGDFEVCRMD